MIIRSSYKEALTLYHEAFASVEYAFYTDYFNAANCAYLISDFDRTFTYIEECLLRGVDLSVFENCSFSQIHGMDKWRRIVASRERFRDRHLQSIDLVLRRRIDLLHAFDQQIRFKHVDRTSVAKEKISEVDNNNLIQLLQNFNEYGVPGEALIGLDNFRSPIFYILWHNN